ncbi:MAG: SDR family NAD(P)-dependent oxidoreductase [Bacteroides sp.]|nr:SDR family NAD(P)-dependent oxidoreductase [Bacteroides sp.]MCM1379840.1 SDR family NAD(P)-dependent oxidoreductase [Bacteroides sp.]MCM1446128.1 SDR family NAD(P)-dependent oxidoreductase [Prevotella sp.]
MSNKILVTGAAGFIGAAVCKRLLDKGCTVVGIDNLNDYYSPELKRARLAEVGSALDFRLLDIADRTALEQVFKTGDFDVVINLAAQAGVRYSLENPYVYADSNLIGFLNILECCRNCGVAHLVYASSSSVYGLNDEIPFKEEQKTDKPASLYAATKKSNELMAHAYSHLFGFATTGLRFFTVYGPWGRPDMAPYLFTDAILNDRPIKVFNGGDMERDFTYIDDVAEIVVRAALTAPSSKFRIFNVGNSSPVNLGEFISEIENATGRVAQKQMLPMQPGDVVRTYADSSAAFSAFGFKPSTPLSEGIKKTVEWFTSWCERR